MYCPKCGHENSEDQKYCRACGFSTPSSLVVSGEAPAATAAKGFTRFIGDELKGWRSLLIYVGLLIVSGLTISVIGHKILDDKTVSDIGTVIASVGVLVLLIKGLTLAAAPQANVLPGPTHQAQSREMPPRGAQAAHSTTAQPRPLLSTEPPAVTENTTRQLETVQVDDGRSRDTQPTQ
ncbi:MAG TPA: zinc ribbon domain-containing protein [Blastocatellia bacterium]|nr:zinc ribbon domain-containing protein [Blastocatellia bacterium]